MSISSRDSLIDWRDADNNITGVNGAEDDYYKGSTRRICAQRRYPVVEELLLVRGIDEQVLYGRAPGRAENRAFAGKTWKTS